MSSSVPSIAFSTTGISIPSSPDILNGVQTDINSAFSPFGYVLNPALETPQGQLASSMSASIADKNNQIAYLVNQLDPQYADGIYQDAIAKYYFLTRKPAVATSVTVILTGIPGAIIPVGAKAVDTKKNIYTNTANATIGSGGTVTATFINTVTGAIPCVANSLNRIYQSVTGWIAINNSADGVIGKSIETRAEFETRRRASVTLNGHGTLESIRAAVFAIQDTTDVFVIDNVTPSIITYGATTYTLAPHSIYVAAIGGNDLSIATAILSKKDAGSDYNGNTTVNVPDTTYSPPQPVYSVKFERPAAVPIYFAVTVLDDPAIPSNFEDLAKDAIYNRFYGIDGSYRERIGGRISASRYLPAINSISIYAQIESLFIGKTDTPTDLLVSIGIDQYPTLSKSNISFEYV